MTHDAYNEAIAADDHWSKLLKKQFGKAAGDVRYTKEGRGEEGSELRAAYEARTKASCRWEEIMRQQRATRNAVRE